MDHRQVLLLKTEAYVVEPGVPVWADPTDRFQSLPTKQEDGSQFESLGDIPDVFHQCAVVPVFLIVRKDQSPWGFRKPHERMREQTHLRGLDDEEVLGDLTEKPEEFFRVGRIHKINLLDGLLFWSLPGSGEEAKYRDSIHGRYRTENLGDSHKTIPTNR